MSTITVQETLITPEEYIAGELQSEIRHEYFAGRVFAMAGASRTHNTIAANLQGELYLHLRGKPCRPFMADMKVRISAASDDCFYYPDILVECSPTNAPKYFSTEPVLIVEVLSPDTERTDQREKLFAYRTLPTLHTYILAAQDKREITIFHKTDSGWEKTVLTGSDTLSVLELGFSTTLDTIYADTGL